VPRMSPNTRYPANVRAGESCDRGTPHGDV
jgi:hypothetical protein